MINFLIILWLSISLYGSTISDAKKLFDEKQDYKKALEIFEQNQEDGEALYYLGKAYLYGMGVEKDEKKAFEYAQKSADKNNPSGLNLLGVMYQYGEGVEKDELQALMYYKQAANLGNTKAMANIGICYYKSNVIKADFNVAKEWFLKAIENGYINGYLNIGDMYYDNYQDKDALSWYLLFESKINFHTNKAFKERVSLLCKRNNDDENAIRLYLALAKDGEYEYTFNLHEYIKKYPTHPEKTQMLFALEKAANKKYNHTKSLSLAQQSIYIYYYFDSNQTDKAVNFAENLYKKENNFQMGCNLASHYGNNKQFKLDFEKSYNIASKIVANYLPSIETQSCYSTLAYLYRVGNYTMKDIPKTIKLNELQFEKIYNKKNDLVSSWIAKFYLEYLQDFVNAKKWYQITYELTKDKKYLTIVDEYIKKQPVYKIDKKTEQAIYPIIENFTNKDQVASVLETDKYYFIALMDKYINMYDKNGLKLLKTFRGWIGIGINGATSQMAYDENKKLLYCASMNSSTDFSQNDIIKVFDAKNGKIVKTINNKNAIKSIYLNISDDGRYLVSINQGQLLNIIEINTNEIQHYNFSNIASFVKANIIKKDDDYLVNVLANDNMLYTFSINKKRQVKKEPFNFQTSFKEFNGLHAQNILKNPDNKILNISDIDLDKNNLKIKMKQLDKTLSFDFKLFSLQQSDKNEPFDRNSKSKITLKYKNYGATVEVYKDDNHLTNLEFYNVKVLNHKIIDDKYIVVITSDVTAMYIFNLQGRAIAKIDSINSIQTNIIYKDGYLISYGKDNIINIFNIEKLVEYEKLPEIYDDEILNGFNKTIGGNILEMLNDSDDDLRKVIKQQVNANNLSYTPTPTQIKTYMKMFLSKKKVIIPIASLYIKNIKDWIIYTPEGLFTYGGEGHKLLKYHQNQGLYKEAKIIENEKLFDKFYRPDLIKKILAGEKVDIPMDVKSVILNINPPELKIISNNMVNEKDIDLTYQICDVGDGVADPKLIINGQAINPPTSRGFTIEEIEAKDEKCKVYKSTHTLNSGENTISLKAYDKDKNIASQSEPIKVMANYKIEEKPNLYFLSIAVSDYKDDNFDLNYPVNDVKKVKEMIQQKSKSVYKNIYTYELHNKDVTLENINTTFDKIKDKIKINDAFILYIAGHGESKDGLYQFIPYDATNKISINDIKSNLSKLQNNKSLVLLDTCQSGAALDSIDETATANRLAYDDNRNYIVASSKNQVALEGYKNHGVFTYSVLDGFEKAYFPGDDDLFVHTLGDYIKRNVPKISKKYFSYEQKAQFKKANDFILGGKN